MFTCSQLPSIWGSRRICRVCLWLYLSDLKPFLWGLHQQNWPSVFLLPRRGAWSRGGGSHGPEPPPQQDPPPGPPFLHPASLFLPLATRPACSLPLAVAGSSSGLRPPSYKKKPGLPVLPQVICAPLQTLMCCPSLFPSLLVASSPVICPGLLPGCHPSVLFITLLKKQNLWIVVSSSSETWEGTSKARSSLI